MKNLILATIFILTTCLPTVAQTDTTKISRTDLQPQFPGGESALFNFMKNNLKFPDKARELNIEGVVYVSFIISETGEVTDVNIVRGIGGGCEEEAIRVVKMMPRWSPGILQGKLTAVKFNYPITFTYQ